MGSCNSVLLKRQFEVGMSTGSLIKIIAQSNPADYYITSIGISQYRIKANVSFGTGIGISLNNRIKIYALLECTGPTQTTVILTSRFRGELYITIALSVFFIIITFSNAQIPFWLCFLGPIMTLWFWAVYRSQENKLADDFEAYLVKQPRMGWPDLK